MTRRRIVHALLTFVAASLLGARSIADEPADFSHDLHVNTVSQPCQACHDTSKPGPPALRTDACASCHDDGTPAWKLPDRSRPLDVRFPHDLHAPRFSCDTCHAATIADKQPVGAPMLVRAQCVTCHAQKGVSVPESSCKTCHGYDRAAVRPPGHDATWLRRHGEEALWQTVAPHGQDCAQCHSTGRCVGCHDQMAPADHTGLWRVRTHGIAASWDRDRCQTCHEPGVCFRCHETTPPANHSGSWLSIHPLVAGSVGNESCAACHSASFCVGCHSGTGVR